MRRICPVCECAFGIPAGEANRAIARGYLPRCSRTCAGVARRVDRSKAERVAMKNDYDRRRREAIGDRLRAEKRAAYYRDHDRHLAQQAELRKDPEFVAKIKAYQHDWIRRPEVKSAKRAADRRRRCVLAVGEEYADAMSVAIDLEQAVRESGVDSVEIDVRNGTLNKSQERKRNGTHETQRRRAQGHALGHAT